VKQILKLTPTLSPTLATFHIHQLAPIASYNPRASCRLSTMPHATLPQRIAVSVPCSCALNGTVQKICSVASQVANSRRTRLIRMRGERLEGNSIGAMRRDVGLGWAALIHGGCLRTAWAGTEIGSCLRFGIRVHGVGVMWGLIAPGEGRAILFGIYRYRLHGF
jgi:hypothetical protein